MTTEPRLEVRTDRRLIRAHGRSERFLLVDLVAPTAAPDPARRRPPVNLAFTLDRSGSMEARNKLDLAKRAVVEATGRLESPDRFAVVMYDDRIDVVVPSTGATGPARADTATRLRDVEARGSTNLHGGWLAGCEQVAGGLAQEGVNRVLLLTDGLANVGVTDHEELVATALDLRRRGISTSTFGVGTDFDETLLQAMADAGGGHFYFIGSDAEVRDHITSEVGEALEVVAREVVLELVVPEQVRVEALSPFRVEQRGGRARVLVGDLVSGQALALVLRLRFDYGEVGREIGALVRVSDRDGVFEAAGGVPSVTLAWAYADHAANDAQARDRDVDRAVASLFADRARQEAVRLNRDGRYDDARRVLEGVRRRVAAYAGSDPVLQQLTGELHEEMPLYAAAMPEQARKQRHFAASVALRMRGPDGRSIKRS